MLTLSNKYSYLFILATGFVLGIYFCSMFSGCGHRAVPVSNISTIKPETLQKQVAAAQASYQVKMDSLGKTAQTLQVALQSTRTALDKAKQKNLILQTQVYDLLDRTAATINDTAARITDCDTLQLRVKGLLANDKVKDSLYDETTTNLQSQLSNKDSTMQVQQDEEETLKVAFSQSVQEQKGLQSENTALRKTIRHRKFASTLKTIGLAAIAALAAHYLTHL